MRRLEGRYNCEACGRESINTVGMNLETVRMIDREGYCFETVFDHKEVDGNAILWNTHIKADELFHKHMCNGGNDQRLIYYNEKVLIVLKSSKLMEELDNILFRF